MDNFWKKGQAMITMVFMMVIGVIVTTGAAYALLGNIGATTQQELGQLAYSTAESGLENGLLRFIRDPSYAGETITVDAGRIATITVSSGTPATITAVGTVGSVVRRVQATVQYINGVFTILTWDEIP
jgi:hypothetical protein